MNIGLIIIFYNNASQIDPKLLSYYIKSSENVEMCLVDNESKDNTLEKLTETKEICNDKVSVVEIKKHVTQEAAKRAGARYMFNNYNLKHIGFVDANALISNEYDINEVVKVICANKHSILDFDNKIKRKQSIKPTLIKSVFSVLEYLRSTYYYDDKGRLKQIV